MGLCLATNPGNNVKHHPFEKDVHYDNHDGADPHIRKVANACLDISLTYRLILLITILIVELKLGLSFGPLVVPGELFVAEAAEDSLFGSVGSKLFDPSFLLNKGYSFKVIVCFLEHATDDFAVDLRIRVFQNCQLLFQAYHGREVQNDHRNDHKQSNTHSEAKFFGLDMLVAPDDVLGFWSLLEIYGVLQNLPQLL